MSERIRKTFTVTTKALGERQIATVISTAARDRENDRLWQDQWVLGPYLRNPVVCWQHDYDLPPIAKAPRTWVEAGELRSVDEFPPQGIYPLADVVLGLVKEGIVGAKSVGFRPLSPPERNEYGGYDYRGPLELLEHSWVSVGANPEALMVARSKGFDHSAMRDWLGPSGSEALIVLDDRPIRSPSYAEELIITTGDKSPAGQLTGDPALVRVALREVVDDFVRRNLPPMIEAAIHKTINRLRGRID